MRNLTLIYVMILINYLIFLIDKLLFPLSFLYLDHSHPQIHAFLTSAFCHADFTHLTGNMFFIYFFGRLIEEEVGAKIFTSLYLLSAVLVNILHFLFSPAGVISVGASGVVFSFFSIGIAIKMKDDWRSWVEILVLAPFVISYLLTEANSLGSQDNVGHFAHLIGAAIGAALFYFLKRFGKTKL